MCHLLSIPFSTISPALGLQLLHWQCSGCLIPSLNIAVPPLPQLLSTRLRGSESLWGFPPFRAGSGASHTQKYSIKAVEDAVPVCLCCCRVIGAHTGNPGAVSAPSWQLPGSFPCPTVLQSVPSLTAHTECSPCSPPQL